MHSNSELILETFSHGKLLLSAEYLVMKGARALALPVNAGQWLRVYQGQESGRLRWTTMEMGRIIFEASFLLDSLQPEETNNNETSQFLSMLLKACRKLNPAFLHQASALEAQSQITFPMKWGLGTSSTLIANMAVWANVMPFELHALVSKGSGYDIACAKSNGPILFQKSANGIEVESASNFLQNPIIKQLNLVYLNQKQATESSIKSFALVSKNYDAEISIVNTLTEQMLISTNLDVWMTIFREHEAIISQVTGQTPVKQRLFPDFQGEIKSLGAWGGDFILVASTESFENQVEYFKSKGYETIFKLQDFIPTASVFENI